MKQKDMEYSLKAAEENSLTLKVTRLSRTDWHSDIWQSDF